MGQAYIVKCRSINRVSIRKVGLALTIQKEEHAIKQHILKFILEEYM